MARGKGKRPTSKAKTKAKSKKSGKSVKPIELYYWPTPNGFKISIMLEECGLPYVLKAVNIS
jgi:GST-like protein